MLLDTCQIAIKNYEILIIKRKIYFIKYISGQICCFWKSSWGKTEKIELWTCLRQAKSV